MFESTKVIPGQAAGSSNSNSLVNEITVEGYVK
jgi:hypothetical protein